MPDNSEGTTARTSSALVDERRVETEAFNFGSEPGDIVSWAYCRRSAPPPDIRSRTVSVLPGTVAVAVGVNVQSAPITSYAYCKT